MWSGECYGVSWGEDKVSLEALPSLPRPESFRLSGMFCGRVPCVRLHSFGLIASLLGSVELALHPLVYTAYTGLF